MLPQFLITQKSGETNTQKAIHRINTQEKGTESAADSLQLSRLFELGMHETHLGGGGKNKRIFKTGWS
jgi:hypothetical protein